MSGWHGSEQMDDLVKATKREVSDVDTWHVTQIERPKCGTKAVSMTQTSSTPLERKHYDVLLNTFISIRLCAPYDHFFTQFFVI